MVKVRKEEEEKAEELSFFNVAETKKKERRNIFIAKHRMKIILYTAAIIIIT